MKDVLQNSTFLLCNCLIAVIFYPMKLYFFARKIEVPNLSYDSRKPKSSELNEIVYCLEGEGILQGDEDSLPITKGTILLNPEGNFQKAKGPFTLGQILFSEDLFSGDVTMEKEALYVLNRIKHYERDPLFIVLSEIGQKRLTVIFDNMLWEYKNRYRGYSWAIRLKLIELLITVIRDKRFKVPLGKFNPTISTPIQDVVTYLNREYPNRISVEDLLQFCPLSRSHFHALFKKETGKTFVDYLNTLRCQAAEEQLISTNKPIIQIVNDCGFNNLSHFYHLFKRKTGVSPKEFQKQHIGIPSTR